MFASVRGLTGAQASVFVVFVPDTLRLPNGLGRAKSHPNLQAALAHPTFLGKTGALIEAVVRDQRYVLVGVGAGLSKDWFDAAAAMGRRLAQHQVSRARAVAAKPDAYAIGLAMGLLSWVHSECKGTGTTPQILPDAELVFETDGQVLGFTRGLDMAGSVNRARDLSQTPPNIAVPLQIATWCQEMSASCGLKFSLLQGAELENHGMTGLINVGKGSMHPPCLIRMEYCPAGLEDEKPLVLIGKTMSYDTGGLSLKDRTGMVGMKRDKDGGCAVIGAMHAIATQVKPNKRVVALLTAAENSVGPAAYRPDDVIVFKNGVSVEVTNTDAEGRLVLADGLCWACENENPRAIVDIATLTGGVVVALGKVLAGYFANDDALASSIEGAANKALEGVWRLPLMPAYKPLMKSPVADILNSNANRQAHPVQGATFLWSFVNEGIPWAHIDIAGTHTSDGDSGAFISGPTGYGVRLLSEWVRDF